MAVGDFNAAGFSDFACYTHTPRQVQLFCGSRSGPVFRSTTTGIEATGLCAGDVTGDGYDDLAFGNNLVGEIWVLPGGMNGFSLPVRVPIVGSPREVRLGDLNGDGIPDIITEHGDNNAGTFIFSDGLPAGLIRTVDTGTSAVGMRHNDGAMLGFPAAALPRWPCR